MGEIVHLIGFTWGIGGVIALLLFAVYRLLPMAMDLSELYLNGWHWLALLFSIVYMAYAEGYQGFHKGFAPRVVIRATYLRNHPRLLHVLLAPFFCMGFLYATRRRLVLSYSLTLMIVVLVTIVRLLPQPWRGIVDAGVVTGLFLGVCSIVYFLVQSVTAPERMTLSAEVPAENSSSIETNSE
ncbi:MAG: hypothetical protein WD772_02320 [Pseudohongiellaceae bacterium]